MCSNYFLCLYFVLLVWYRVVGHFFDMQSPNCQKVAPLWAKLNQPSWTKPRKAKYTEPNHTLKECREIEDKTKCLIYLTVLKEKCMINGFSVVDLLSENNNKPWDCVFSDDSNGKEYLLSCKKNPKNPTQQSRRLFLATYLQTLICCELSVCCNSDSFEFCERHSDECQSTSESTKNISLEQGCEHGHNRSRKPSKETHIVVSIHLPSASFDAKDSGGTLHNRAWPQVSLDSGYMQGSTGGELRRITAIAISLITTLQTAGMF